MSTVNKDLIGLRSEQIILFPFQKKKKPGGRYIVEKLTICSILGVLGSYCYAFFDKGGDVLHTLIVFMIIDYISGLIVSGVLKRSKKTPSGKLSSEAGWKGLCKKGMMLFFVMVGYRLDILIGEDYIMNAVCIGYIVNELISIIENAGLMRVPIPNTIKNVIDVLDNKNKEDS